MKRELDQEYYLGTVHQSYFGYTYNKNIRGVAASGGLTTEILQYCLMNKDIQGALVSRSIIVDGTLQSESKIIQNPEELLTFTGSVYFPISIKEYIQQIREFQGKIAIVGLPCHLKVIEEMIAREPHLSSKIVLKIALFCGHNSQKDVIIRVLQKKRIDISQIKKLIFRRGHWRGEMNVEMVNGQIIRFPFSDFSIYQNLHILSEKKCIHCFDHMGESSDISLGDAWLSFLKSDPIKHSIIMSRSNRGTLLLDEMRKSGSVYLTKIEPEVVFKSQKRALIYHKAQAAREKVAKMYGLQIHKKPGVLSPRWNEILASHLIMMNYQISKSPRLLKILFTLPKEILFPFLGLFKILTNF